MVTPARRRLDHVDAMCPVKQAGVISTHTLVTFAPTAASVISGAVLLLLHVYRLGFSCSFVSSCVLTYACRDLSWRGSPASTGAGSSRSGCYLAGVALVRPGWSRFARDVVRSGSDNACGVYLTHMLVITALAWLGRKHLDAVLSWPLLCLLTVGIVVACCVPATALLARTQQAPRRELDGQGQRGALGGLAAAAHRSHLTEAPRDAAAGAPPSRLAGKGLGGTAPRLIACGAP